MANPVFRFTLSHTTAGTKPISEPVGWKEAKLKLTRDPEFHSLIEYFEADLIFYGSNGTVDGGIDFIRNVDAIGPDEDLTITVEISVDGGLNFDDLFIGQLDLTALEERENNQMAVPIIRNDLWIKFVNRYETPTNLRSNKDIDGDSISVPDSVRINLSPQWVRYVGQYTWFESFNYSPSSTLGGILILDWDTTINDDLKKFSLPRATTKIVGSSPNFVAPAGIFEAPYDGVYNFDIRIEWSNLIDPTGTNVWTALTGDVDFYIVKTFDSQDSPSFDTGLGITLGQGVNRFSESVVTYGSETVAIARFVGSFHLFRGDQMSIYGSGNTAALGGTGLTVFGSEFLDWKTNCRLATQANVTLSGLQTIDGVSGANNDRILVWKQSDQTQNGIWIMHSGAWTRATDADSSAELLNAAVFVTAGTVAINTAFKQVETFVALGTTPINFSTTNSSDTRYKKYPGYPGRANTYLNITADTTFPQTDTHGFLIHDAAQHILQRTVKQNNPFFSEHFGSSLTTPSYPDDGCAHAHVLTQGFQLRAVGLDAKPLYMSFSDWWKGANPIFNLGLSYDTISGQEIIRVEKKQFFYDPSPSTLISSIKDIKRTYDTDYLINKIEIGYQKWQSVDLSTIDDPQGKHTYSTALHKIAKGITLYSTFVAASLAIETTRRQAVEKLKDYKFDTDVFIISVVPLNISPDSYTPELSEHFDSVGGLLNSSTRYNLLLTPMRMLLRWGNYLSIGIQSYINRYPFKFVSGEGNVKMSSDYHETGNPSICLGIISDLLVENQDIPLGAPSNYKIPIGCLHLPDLYTIQIDMDFETYESIRNSRTNAIGISQTTTGHVPLFIKDMEYIPASSKATIIGWTTQYLQITSADYSPSINNCISDTNLRSIEDDEIRLLESGEKRTVN